MSDIWASKSLAPSVQWGIDENHKDDLQGSKEYECPVCQYKTSNYSTFQAIPTFNPTKLVVVHSILGHQNSKQVPQTEFESGTSNRSDGSILLVKLSVRISVVDLEICGLIRSGFGIIFFELGSGTVLNLLIRTNIEIRKFYS